MCLIWEPWKKQHVCLIWEPCRCIPISVITSSIAFCYWYAHSQFWNVFGLFFVEFQVSWEPGIIEKLLLLLFTFSWWLNSCEVFPLVPLQIHLKRLGLGISHSWFPQSLPSHPQLPQAGDLLSHLLLKSSLSFHSIFLSRNSLL